MESLARYTWAWALVGILLAAGTSFAVDGVLEINAVRAIAGGVTEDDAPGYPVTLGEPGSYRLTGPLRLTGSSQNAIEITSSDVTVDLNGFTISCRAASNPVGPPNLCLGNAGVRAEGTDADPIENVTVVNGIISGFFAGGVVLQPQVRTVRVERIIASNNVGPGIGCFANCRIKDCIARDNGGDGLTTGTSSIVEGSVSVGNGGNGITLGTGNVGAGLVSRNTVRSNDGVGVRCGSESGIINGNSISNNNPDVEECTNTD
jgi:hypothetical protein